MTVLADAVRLRVLGEREGLLGELVEVVEHAAIGINVSMRTKALRNFMEAVQSRQTLVRDEIDR